MKVVAFNGSPRKDGNTKCMLDEVARALNEEDISCDVVDLGGLNLKGCLACYQCFDKKNCRCANAKDDLNVCIEAMVEADGIIIGSPTYFSNVSPEVKALIDRAGLVAKANGDLFRRKVGAAVVAVRRAGSLPTFDAINHFFLISQMVVPGSSYWNVGIGREKGEVLKDEEGIATMRVLGENMAWLMKKIAQ